jgi:hypothetical protein
MARKPVQLIVLILFLAACAEPQQNEQPATQTPEVIPQQTVTPEVIADEPATRVVEQGSTKYGLSEDNRILSIEKPEGTWKLHYDEGRLVSITGLETITFSYNGTKLANITAQENTLTFRYGSHGKVIEVRGGREPLYFDYDSLDLVRAVRRGVAGKTSIDYDKKGQIKYLTRGLITTNVYFTNRSLPNNFDAGDTKLILSYWKDDKLASLAGKTFGQGLTVSYGPD